MGHQVNLGVHGVGPPDDDQVGLSEFSRIATLLRANARFHASQHYRRADRVVLARIPHGIAQPLDTIALHLAHRTGIVIQPDSLRTALLRGFDVVFGHDIECVVPRYRYEIVDRGRMRFSTLAAHRLRQPRGMMHPLGIARDLGADDTGGIRVGIRPVDTPYLLWRLELDIQRTRASAIVRAD